MGVNGKRSRLLQFDSVCWLRFEGILSQDGNFVCHAGLLEDPRCFDLDFFGISKEQASLMDPQQSLLMECMYHTVSQVRDLGSDVGVWIGLSASENLEPSARALDATDGRLSGHFAVSNNRSATVSKVSYTFNFEGCAVAVDTACSSSLIALDVAATYLCLCKHQWGLVGGVNIILSSSLMRRYADMKMLDVSGCCRSFDATANGMVRSEGCGTMLLQASLKLQDPCLAEILGTASNNNGGGLPGNCRGDPESLKRMMWPSGPAQKNLIKAALSDAKLSGSEVGCVEAHATGTSFGDEIEGSALSVTFGQSSIVVGACKSVLGHHEAAAGIMGLLKVIQSMTRKCVPPNQHLNVLNPHIRQGSKRCLEFPGSHLTLGGPEVTKFQVASVSSFGFSGTNANVILRGQHTGLLDKQLCGTPMEHKPIILPIAAASETALSKLSTLLSHEFQNVGGSECQNGVFPSNAL